MQYVALAATAMSAVGALEKGQSEANALEYQATVQRNNAVMAQRSAKMNADRQQLIAGQRIGSMSADYAASGVDIHTSGSVLSVIGASAANAELDRQNIIHGGDIRAVNYENQASLDETSAGHALSGSYFSAAAQLVAGGARMYGYKYGDTGLKDGDDQWFESKD